MSNCFVAFHVMVFRGGCSLVGFDGYHFRYLSQLNVLWSLCHYSLLRIQLKFFKYLNSVL